MPQKIVVTTCPWKDYKTGKWMLSAMMNIQLETAAETTLAAFPDILKWMEKIHQAVFYVQWNNSAPSELLPVTTKWNPALYEKLFHSGIKVKGFAPLNLSTVKIKSYPVKHISNFIFDTYKEVGNLKMTDLPKASFFTKEYTKLNPISKITLTQTTPITNQNKRFSKTDFIRKGHTGQVQVKQQLSGNRVIAYNQQPNVDKDFGQLHNYFAKTDKILAKGPAPIPPKDFEYHDVFSVITSYPVILRKLGLIVDFVLPAAPASAKGTVRIVPTNLGFAEDVSVVAPNTSYESTANGFYAAPKAGSPIDKGLLKLNTEEFDVVTYDTDAAAVKLVTHTETIVEKTGMKLADKSNYFFFQMIDSDVYKNLVLPIENEECGPAVVDDKEDTDEGLPALRSAGIGLVKNGLAENIFNKLKASEVIFTGFIKPENQLKSVELLNTNKTQPVINFKDPTAIKKVRDAGQVKIKAVIANPVILPPASQTLFADDLVQGYRMDIAYEEKPSQWYSLHKRKNTYGFLPVGAPAAENISLTEDEVIDEGCINIALVEDENDEDKNTDKVNEVIARWQGWSLAVPKPGKGINEDNANIVSNDTTEKEKYKLKDNVPFRMQVNMGLAPKTLPMLRFGKTYRLKVRTVDIAGNSLPHDVAPENANVAVKTGIKYLRYEPLPVPVLVGTDEIASKANDKVRERDGESLEHMVIRSNVGVSSNDYEKQNPTNIYQEGTRNVTNTLTWLHEAVRHFKAPRNSQHMAETHGMFDESFSDPAKAAETYKFITSRDIETDVNSTETKAPLARITDTNLPIEYLADPMAAGVVLVMKSNTTFESNWKKDQARKFSFYFDDEVSDTTANTSYTKNAWKNPKSFRIKLVEGNGTVEWSKPDRMLIVALPKSAEIEIKYASFWRPDDVDKYNALQPIVGLGINKVQSLDYARKSLHWMFSPWRNIRLVHAVQQPLENPAFEPNTLKSDRNYNDTFAKLSAIMKVHGSSTDKVDIEASWTEQIDDLKNINIITGQFNTHVATLQVAYCNKKLTASSAKTAGTAEERRFPQIHHPFNDTRHRMVNYKGVATSRYREYFTGIIETGEKTNKPVSLIRAGDAVQLNILSTARPATAVVEYVVPSFNWLTSDKGSEITRMRTGNIRVYLQRPWYSSGDDEMLGVLLPIKNVMLSEAGKLHCTVWGKDPVFNSPELNGANYPQVENFPFAAAYDTVSLAEDESTKMTVAAYKVLFDEEKQLHYADIPVNINQAYFPFVRLCVARYQKHSLKINNKDCCISPTTTVDWLQVVPVRYTALYFKGGKNEFDVALRGTAPFTVTGQKFMNNNTQSPSRCKITVTVENTTLGKSDDAFISMNDRPQGINTSVFIKQYYLDRQQFKGSQIEFVERISLGSSYATQPFRVVIREYELHEFDPIRVAEDARKRAFDRRATNVPAPVPQYEERLVFMDVFEVNGSV
jgi:hypothetical protein